MAAEAIAERDHIRFLLDGEVHTVGGFDPKTTVLVYLREELRRCGTKEGCAEGDCGACTVVEVEASGGRLTYRAVNSCIQLLALLDGKALFTVESLKHGMPGRELHPVKTAMLHCHGSQCGFCTPGFVMSLFALFKTTCRPGRCQIDRALAGNLCRCTGYRPIIEAASRMYDYAEWLPAPARSWLTEPGAAVPPTRMAPADEPLAAELDAIRPSDAVQLQSPRTRYFAPSDLDGLLTVLGEHPDATVLAGGTDVGLWITKEQRELPVIVWLGNVAELNRCGRHDDFLEIGAAVTLADAFGALENEIPDLYEIARRFASPPICNLGTLCGNIATGSPIGDALPPLMALGARLVLCSAGGDRQLPLEDFYSGYRRNALRPGEIIKAARVPKPASAMRFRAYKVAKRFDQDISTVCVGLRASIAAGRFEDVRIAIGGMAPTVCRAAHTEQLLEGTAVAGLDRAAVRRSLAQDYSPLTDLRGRAEYRLSVATNLIKRFAMEISGIESASVWEYTGQVP